jgi:DNA-binding beta-propeller fold protein YncE
MPRCCIVTAYQGDGFAELAALTLPRMEAFAARHGYALIVHKPDGSGFTDSWMKVPAIISALRSDFDYVLWLDIDALILRTDRDILEDAQTGADLLVSWHGPETARLDGMPFPPHYNAGIYLIRKSEWSLEFFNRLLALHGKVTHPWLEQAALLAMLGYNEPLDNGPNVANELDRAHVGHLDPIWNSIPGIAMAADPIIHHFAGLKGAIRLDLVKATAEILPVYETASPAIRSALSQQISRWAAAEHAAQSLKRTIASQTASTENQDDTTREIERLKQEIARLRAPRQMLRALPGAVSKRLRDKIDDVSGITSSSPGLKFEVDPTSFQNLRPEGKLERFEGLAFSSSGNTLGVATADSNAVLLYRRTKNGNFEDTPYFRLGGLDYPHDLSFSTYGSSELLAVAQRTGALALFRENGNGYDPDPVFEISGAETKLTHSDGVSFVPPFNDYLAACNLGTNSISFYSRLSLSPLRFALKPDFELTHSSVVHPDGLAFSQCGRWLAVANHGNGSVSIFQRRNKFFPAGKLKYGLEPVTIIEDQNLWYPHSVAFTPRTNHLVVTNAGGNFFSVYEPRRSHFGLRWNQMPSVQTIVGDETTFRAVNAHNKMEGGPKGLAVHGNNIAVCSPEIGIKIYSFQEA